MADARTVIAQRDAAGGARRGDGVELPDRMRTPFEDGRMAEASARGRGRAQRASSRSTGARPRAAPTTTSSAGSACWASTRRPTWPPPAPPSPRGDIEGDAWPPPDDAYRAWTGAWQEGRRRALLAVAGWRRSWSSPRPWPGACAATGGPSRPPRPPRRLRSPAHGGRPRPARVPDGLVASRATMSRRRSCRTQGDPPRTMRRAPVAAVLALAPRRRRRLLPAAAPGAALPAVLAPARRPRRGRHRHPDRRPLRRRARRGPRPGHRRRHGRQPQAQQHRAAGRSPATSTTASTWASSRRPAAPRHPGRRAASGSTSPERDGYRLVTVLFRDGHLLRRVGGGPARPSTSPAGKPRSASDVRVGAAFATFMAWAFGDRGHGPGRGPGRLRRRHQRRGARATAPGRARAPGLHGRRPTTRSTGTRGSTPPTTTALTRDRLDPARAATRSSSAAGRRTRAGGRGSDAARATASRSSRPDRPAVAGGRRAHRDRGPHAAARGLRGLLRRRRPTRSRSARSSTS